MDQLCNVGRRTCLDGIGQSNLPIRVIVRNTNGGSGRTCGVLKVERKRVVVIPSETSLRPCTYTMISEDHSRILKTTVLFRQVFSLSDRPFCFGMVQQPRTCSFLVLVVLHRPAHDPRVLHPRLSRCSDSLHGPALSCYVIR